MIDSEPQKGLSLSTPFLTSRGPRMKVELDKKALFALASDSRMEILKELQTSRKTVSQLAEALNIDKAAVHRHLKKLEEGGFVSRDEDHGFVYYGLSWKARDIIAPGENTRIVIIFSLSWLMVLGALSAIVLGLGTTAMRMGEATQNNPADYGSPAQYIFSHTNSTELTILALVLLIVAGLLAYYGIRRLRRPKQAATE